MRVLLFAGVLCLGTVAAAEPDEVPGEVIHIHQHVGVVQLPKLLDDAGLIPEYSDDAILTDAWTKAWLWLDIDDQGVVQRVKFLERPGHGLDQTAVDWALSRHFEPARNQFDHAVRSLAVFPVEWPSYYYLKSLKRSTRRLPVDADYAGYAVNGVKTSHGPPPCAGTGPMALFAVHPIYRDCSVPDLSHADASETWITRH